MKRFAVFNPEHDLALANGDAHYLAPRNIREMAHDLAPLMDYLAWDTPWGWDAAIVNYLHKSGIPRQELPNDAMLAALRTRSERITAHHLLQQMLPLSGHLTGESYVCRSLDDIKAYATQHSHLLLKAPLSGSGKGLRHLNLNDDVDVDAERASVLERVERFALTTTEALALQRSTACSLNHPSRRSLTSTLTLSLKKIEHWADALIRRHGYLTAEPYYDKVQDFAMEFFVANGQCHFIGYSLFTTDNHGRYDSNLLLSDADIEERLSEYIPCSVLHDVRHFVETHSDLIIPAEWDTSRFPITFGIDMMVIKTTGKVAIEREQRLLAGSAERSNFNEVNRQQTLTVSDERLEVKEDQPDGNSEFRIQNSAAQREQSQVCLSYAADAKGASVATDETLVSQRSSNLLLFTKNLNAEHYNSEFKLHPCVEINLRANMGIVAHEVRRHLMAPEATGIYRLALFANHAALAAFDEEQRALYPALYRDGLLVRGYHPLTSTEGNTRHLAYIIGGITQL